MKKTTAITIAEILDKNPHVDGKVLQEGRQLLSKIRRMREGARSRECAVPYDRPMIVVGRTEEEEDSRMILLGRR